MSLSEPNTYFSVFISGIIFGIIFFQSFISAPLIFKHIDKKNSSAYIRKVFPRIFLIIPLLSIISLVVSYFQLKFCSKELLIVCLTSIFLPLICYLLIPSHVIGVVGSDKCKPDGQQLYRQLEIPAL